MHAVKIRTQGPRLKFFFMLNSALHEIFPAHNVKMPTTGKKGILSLSEPEHS